MSLNPEVLTGRGKPKGEERQVSLDQAERQQLLASYSDSS